jgi:hypothetical protein
MKILIRTDLTVSYSFLCEIMLITFISVLNMEGHKNPAFIVQDEDRLQLHVSIKSLFTYCDRRIHIIFISVVHEPTMGIQKLFQGFVKVNYRCFLHLRLL